MAEFWALPSVVLALLSMSGSIELLLLTVGGVLPLRWSAGARSLGALPEGESGKRFAVVVPAHNEAAGIAACVQSLHACDPGSGAFTVVVVADNCEDDTAARAEVAGARVLVRHDPERRGKGHALDFAFRQLLIEPFDVFMVVDADTRVEPNLFVEAQRRFGAGADAVQSRYCVGNPGDSVRTRLMNVALQAFNVLRPRGREFWGLSVGLLGNGFGLSRATLEAVPYDAASVAEDLEYHIRLVQNGRRVRFLDGTTVWSAMPSGERASRHQRARWEGGRLRMIREQTPILLRGIVAGRWREVEPLLELWLLPLAFHVMLLILTLLPPFMPGRIYALGALVLVGLHVLAAIRVGGGGWRDLQAVAAAPFYLLWKLAMFGTLLRSARRDAAWVRTDREPPPSSSSLPQAGIRLGARVNEPDKEE
ncbi:MAG: glycosyltransferase family 2 protein [Hyphomicrobiaceae bacterium]